MGTRSTLVHLLPFLLIILCTDNRTTAASIQERVLEFTVEENCPVGTELGTVAAASMSPQQLGTTATTALRYQLGSRSKLFAVNEQTARLTTLAALDAEALCARAKEQQEPVNIAHAAGPSQTTDPSDAFVDHVTCKPNGQLFVHLDVNTLLADGSLRAVYRINIRINDLNDNGPHFDQTQWSRQLKEMLYRRGRRIELPKATDPDLLDEYSRVRYHLESVNASQGRSLSGPFRLEIGAQGQPGLILTEDLDAERQARHELVLVASSPTPIWSHTNQLVPSESRLRIIIEVVDMNDNEPRFETTAFNVSVAEDTAPDTVIFQLTARDPDSTAQLTYSMGSSAEGGLLNSTFNIDPDGAVRLRSFLDFELKHLYKVPVKVSDGEFTAQAHLFVHVLDVNDEPPVFEINPQQLVADENAPAGKLIGRVRIRDPDSDAVNGRVRCWEPPGKRGQQILLFHPDPASNPTALVYDLTTRVVLDREAWVTETSRGVHLICSDGNHDSVDSDRGSRLIQHTATMTATVVVRDENDHAPAFDRSVYHVTMAENNRIGEKVLRVNATDQDEGDNARIGYSLLDTVNFKIDPLTGWVTANVVFDRESRATYPVTIIATDHGKPRLSSSTLMNLTITDQNDHYPSLLTSADDWIGPPDPTALAPTGRLSPSSNVFAVTEHLAPGTHIGDVLARDKDLGVNAQFRFALVGATGPPGSRYEARFRILANGSLYTTVELDREEQEQYQLLVSVSDLSPTEPLTSTGTIRVLVRDVNDHAPTFVQPVEGLYNPTDLTNPTNQEASLSNVLSDQPDWAQSEGRSAHQSGGPDQSEKPAVRLSVHEKPGFLVTTLHAKDADTGRNARVTYELMSHGASGPPFVRVRPDRGDVMVQRHMTKRDVGRHYFDVSASDDGYPHPRRQDKVLIIDVEDKPARGDLPSHLFATSYYSNNISLPRFEFWLFEGRTNTFVITILASVSGLLAIVLITATLCVVRPCNRSGRGGPRCCAGSTEPCPGERPITAPGEPVNGQRYAGRDTNGRHYGYLAAALPDHIGRSPYGTGAESTGLFLGDQTYTCDGSHVIGFADTTYRSGMRQEGGVINSEALSEQVGLMNYNLIEPNNARISHERPQCPVQANRMEEHGAFAIRCYENPEEGNEAWNPLMLPVLPNGTGLSLTQLPGEMQHGSHTFAVVKPIPIQAQSLECWTRLSSSELASPSSSDNNPSTAGGPWVRNLNPTDLSFAGRSITQTGSQFGEEFTSDSGRGASEEDEVPQPSTERNALFTELDYSRQPQTTFGKPAIPRPTSPYAQQYI